MMFDWIFVLDAWFALLTLIVLEIVLGIDNIIFLTITVEKLPQNQQTAARRSGLIAAMLMRILLLLSLSFIAKLTYPIFSFTHNEWRFFTAISETNAPIFSFSVRDAILCLGGLFLVWKGLMEIKELFTFKTQSQQQIKTLSFASAIAQIMVLDLVFSLDSVITAVGLGGEHISIMILAIMIAVLIMLFCAKPIGDFIEREPAMKLLALAFLVLVGAMLVIEGFHWHISKNYLYFALFFALIVEGLNILRRKK